MKSIRTKINSSPTCFGVYLKISDFIEICTVVSRLKHAKGQRDTDVTFHL